MPTVEVTAKTVQDATRAAAEKLGVATEAVRVTVLEESKGLFGKSTVRVRGELLESPAAVAVAPGKRPAAEADADEKPAPKRRGRAKAEEVEAPVAVAEAAPETEEKPKRGRGRTAKTELEPESDTAEPREEREVAAATAQDAEQLLSLTKSLLESAGLDVDAHAGEVSGRYVNVILDGKDAAHLVGKHGEVLNAFQYLVNIIGGKKFNNGIRVTLDGNDYRRRREEALTALATKIANEVKARGEEAVLDALPAFERRIVHKALSEIGGITTYSEGEEPNRRVVIAPAD